MLTVSSSSRQKTRDYLKQVAVAKRNSTFYCGPKLYGFFSLKSLVGGDIFCRSFSPGQQRVAGNARNGLDLREPLQGSTSSFMQLDMLRQP